MQRMIHALFDAIDPDKHQQPIVLLESPTESLTPEQIQVRTNWFITEACKPFDNPDVRNTLIELKRQQEQTIDIVSQIGSSLRDLIERQKRGQSSAWRVSSSLLKRTGMN